MLKLTKRTRRRGPQPTVYHPSLLDMFAGCSANPDLVGLDSLIADMPLEPGLFSKIEIKRGEYLALEEFEKGVCQPRHLV